MKDQDLIFKENEGNAWYHRNAKSLDIAGRADAVIDVLNLLSKEQVGKIGSICDIGCSRGDRLNRLSVLFPDAKLCGFDASEDAVNDGKAQFPALDLRQGLVDEPPFDQQFDLVIISFVMHWIDRRRLAQAVAAIDSLVANGGLMILSDFLPDRQCAREYHHRDDVRLFTYKQDYGAIFTSLGLYREMTRNVFAHDRTDASIGISEDQNRAMCALLEKSVIYPVVIA